MEEAGADTLATVFHSCHREAVALERGRPIRVANWIHLLADAMGLALRATNTSSGAMPRTHAQPSVTTG